MGAAHLSRVRAWLGLLLVQTLAFWLPGCATVTIIPPALPADPVNVFVLDHGRTTSLAIAASGGGLLRYAYGDWNYYALGKNDLWHGIAALFWPTQSGLGRGELEGPATVQSVQNQMPWLEAAHSVRVERALALAFEWKMEALFDSLRDTQVDNSLYRLSFVHYPRPYTVLWNSNHAVAAWLHELGCETRGWPLRASWRLAPAQ
ncbi:MAG: hypothetical protein ACRES3_10915 [Steroidobacteraceae bacterium]